MAQNYSNSNLISNGSDPSAVTEMHENNVVGNRPARQFPPDPHFPNAPIVAIYLKKPRKYFERVVREYLASGHDIVILTALGNAIPICVYVRTVLEQANAVKLFKIETYYNPLEPNKIDGSPGLRIYLQKHPDFKGSVICPRCISFPENDVNDFNLYEESQSDSCASVLEGASLTELMNEGSTGAKLLQSLSMVPADVVATLQKLLTEAKNKTDGNAGSAIIESSEQLPTNLRYASCYISPDLAEHDSTGLVGATFLLAFSQKYVYNNESNSVLIYVVTPQESKFTSKTAFLKAVVSTASTLMSALCKLNTFIRRYSEMKRIFYCRLPCICLSANKADTDVEVAEAILNGLSRSYTYQDAPRFKILNHRKAFTTAWVKTTGLDVPSPDTHSHNASKNAAN